MSTPRGAGYPGAGALVPHGDQAVFDGLVETFMALVSITLADPDRPGDFARAADCAWAWTPVAIAEVNRVLAPRLAGAVATVKARVEAINAAFGRRPFSWWLDPAATPRDLAEILRWVAPRSTVERVPVMVLDLDGFQRRPLRPGVVTALAETTDQLVTAELLSARGFEAGDDAAEPFASMFEAVTAPPGGPLAVAVASLDDRPAATALGVLAGDLVGIYNVSTLPEARHRGLGRAAMDAVLGEAVRRGARRAVLESSEDGIGLYGALGFRVAGECVVVTVPEQAGVTA